MLAANALDSVLYERLFEITKEAGVSIGDCLIAVPPTLVQGSEGIKHAKVAEILKTLRMDVWDASDDRVRLTPRQSDEVAIVPYASIRGLEGWAAILLDLDEWDSNRLRHPNVEAGESVTADDVARRALLLAVTRAAHVLVVTTRDPQSRVARWLEEASVETGGDIVERW